MDVYNVYYGFNAPVHYPVWSIFYIGCDAACNLQSNK